MRRLLVVSRRVLAVAVAAAAEYGRGALATAALAAVAVGLWWERPSLALIVPGTFVLTALVWGHLRGGHAQ